jgi:signal transduction histidine kinase
VLEVRDDGPGVPEDQREAVFQLFTRTDSARSRGAGGFGLGLPIARQIAESHGGTLTVHGGGLNGSRPHADGGDPRAGGAGEGARFVLRLPLRG